MAATGRRASELADPLDSTRAKDTNVKTIQRQILVAAVLVGALALTNAHAQQQPDEARAIAKEAFVYGFPIVDAYQTLYKQAVDKGGPDFKAPFNHIGNVRDVATPAFRSIITPNSDTPY